jgi:hypothetical protein
MGFYHPLLRPLTNYAPQAEFLTVGPKNLALNVTPHQKLPVVLQGILSVQESPIYCTEVILLPQFPYLIKGALAVHNFSLT